MKLSALISAVFQRKPEHYTKSSNQDGFGTNTPFGNGCGILE